MTKIDNKFVFYYTEHARGKIRDIARIMKKSSQRLKYNIKVLEQEEYITYPYTIVDYSFFGVLLFRVYFKGGYINDADKQNIVNKLKENSYVVAIYDLTGEFDLCIEIGAPNPSRFKKELKKVETLIPTLNNYKIVLNVVSHIYPRHYLLRNEEIAPHYINPDVIIGGDRASLTFSLDELSVLKCLIEQPRIRLTFLAKKSGLNVKTVVSILKKLYERKVIKGFKYVLNTEKLGIHRFRLFLRLHDISEDREKQFMEFMDTRKEIVLINKTVGDWDMELDVESITREEVRAIIVNMREQFKDIIENFNIIEENKFYVRKYLPMYVFNPPALESKSSEAKVYKDVKKIVKKI